MSFFRHETRWKYLLAYVKKMRKREVSFSSCQLSLFIHGTEDSKKILNAIHERLGIQENKLELENLEGYFGNPVISVRWHALGEEADAIASRVFGSMDLASRTKFRNELLKSVDEHDALYLRIDKQGLKNTVSLSDEEAIHLKFKPKNRSDRDTILKFYRGLC